MSCSRWTVCCVITLGHRRYCGGDGSGGWCRRQTQSKGGRSIGHVVAATPHAHHTFHRNLLPLQLQDFFIAGSGFCRRPLSKPPLHSRHSHVFPKGSNTLILTFIQSTQTCTDPKATTSLNGRVKSVASIDKTTKRVNDVKCSVLSRWTPMYSLVNCVPAHFRERAMFGVARPISPCFGRRVDKFIVLSVHKLCRHGDNRQHFSIDRSLPHNGKKILHNINSFLISRHSTTFHSIPLQQIVEN